MKIDSVHKKLVNGIRDFAEKNQFKKSLIGLSGGIDSSLTAVLAVQALGKKNVWGVAMPSRISSKESVSDAKQLAKNLGIKFSIIPISAPYNSLIKELKNEFKGTKKDVTEENLQARIRGVILMSLSNKFGALVLATGNKSEAMVGYCTLYGDTVGGLAPISDLYKKDVYALSRFINRKKEIIPKNVLKKAPSAELSPGQKDSDTLPDYKILDPILEAIEKKKTKAQIISLGFKKKTVEDVKKMIKRNAFKSLQCPPKIPILK